MDLFDRLLLVVGASADDEQTTELFRSIPEEPELESDSLGDKLYRFYQHGFAIQIHPRFGVGSFVGAFFLYCHVPESWTEVHHGFQAFSGRLPFGIKHSDTRNEVRLKIGHAPSSTDYGYRPRMPNSFWVQELQPVLHTEWAKSRERSLKYRRRRTNKCESVIDKYIVGKHILRFIFHLEDNSLIGLEVIANWKAIAPAETENGAV
jgi:hypothetical protein